MEKEGGSGERGRGACAEHVHVPSTCFEHVVFKRFVSGSRRIQRSLVIS